MKRTKSILATLATLMVLLGSASGLLAQNQTLGLPEEPHGYPAYFQDSNGLKLELCLDPTLCVFEAVEAGNAFSEAIGFGPEAFWLLASAQAPFDAPIGGTVTLTLALEAAFGGDAAVKDGNQISFGRVRIRFDDITLPGQYRVTHPYGVNEFTLTSEDLAANPDRPLNYVKDVGGTNPGNPAAAFNGTLASDIMNPGNSVFALNATSFITSLDYANNTSLLVDGKRYISDGTPGPIEGSPYDTNFLRVQRFQNGDWEQVAYTESFTVNGRVFDETRTVTEKTTYDNLPTKKLIGHGPVNREQPFVPWSNVTVTGFNATGGIGGIGFPIGYPLWYEDASGLKLTIPSIPDMGLSEPVNVSIPEQNLLKVGGETFYWSATSSVNANGIDAKITLGVEGTFGGAEELIDGNQITFGRVRIDILSAPVDGNYTIEHPYGTLVVEVIADEDGDRSARYVEDLGGTNPFDPDSAFEGTLYSDIGPNFLTWTSFNKNPMLTNATLIRDNPIPSGPKLYFVGDPAILQPVTGGTNPAGNIFRVTAPNGSVAETNLFAVTGQVVPNTAGFLPSIYLLLNE